MLTGGCIPRTALQNPWGCVTFVAMGIIDIGISRKFKPFPSVLISRTVEEISFAASVLYCRMVVFALQTMDGDASSGNEQQDCPPITDTARFKTIGKSDRETIHREC